MCIRDSKCTHEFKSKIGHVTDGHWCPFCSIHNRKLCGEKSCKLCVKNSFAYFHHKDKVNAWSSKNEFKPYEVTISSGKKSIFECYKCGHEFKSQLSVIYKGHWCPCCYAAKNKFIKKLFEIFHKMEIEYKFEVPVKCGDRPLRWDMLSLIHISEPTRPLYISYAVFCLKKKNI